ncbi:hypothetical protein APHNP_1708 [Anaplasma phagocytophilum str. ApNP]|uniref:Uncharacterized protein n=2 Tax=Anaplasma phagocytophilum TaxID=948 RepID=A0A0F3NHD0_ANAPH|nr:hypothetical protein APHMUC_0139 [Anaplasma phagocytophilum str. ApMUC09]KJV67097.1 hypothetical protein APHNP_1708 [Anaplasma phagocytophilum str. ApNP]
MHMIQMRRAYYFTSLSQEEILRSIAARERGYNDDSYSNSIYNGTVAASYFSPRG